MVTELIRKHLACEFCRYFGLDVDWMVIGAGYNARTEREMLKWDYLVFFVFDQDSFSRGEAAHATHPPWWRPAHIAMIYPHPDGLVML